MSRLLCLAVVLALPGVAGAFTIRTVASEPCHERIMLGAFDVPGGFGSRSDPDLSAVLARWRSAAEEDGLPGGRSKAAFDQMAADYGYGELDAVDRYIVGSLVVGVREPDTDGFAAVKLSELRSVHLRDDTQAEHSLRRSSDDGDDGNRDAIQAAQDLIEGHLDVVRAMERGEMDLAVEARWTFPFYGPTRIRVFGPAHRMGKAAHALQDAFTHTLRDDALKIVTVLNFVDAVLARDEALRDGLPHSDRLDECNISGDDFDALRVGAARDATAGLVAALYDEVDAGPDRSATSVVLDDVYELRPGCDTTNEYCETSWLEPARSGFTEPIRLWFCAANDVDAPLPPEVLWLAALIVGARLRLRRAGRA